MKVIIAGSRDIKSYDIQSAVDRSGFKITEEVCGKCPYGGIDKLGEEWARTNNIPVKPFYPKFYNDEGNFDRSAGPLRNRKMALYAEALILIWNGKSRGSASMLREAQGFGLLIHQELVK